MTQPRPSRASVLGRIVALATGLTVVAGAIALSSSTPAAAAGLTTFTSCEELQTHLRDAAGGWGVPDDVAFEESSAGGAGQAAAAPLAAADGTGGTNVQVEGVDELDVVDVLADGRTVVARGTEVLMLSADGRAVLDRLASDWDPQLSVDDERGLLWIVTSDGMRTALRRVALTGDGFGDAATWSVAGRLVTLRRSGDRVHLVAVDDGYQHAEAGGGDAAVPFGGTSPVPCDEVLHTTLPTGPATTLVAAFAATGPLEPTAATEIVGTGEQVLVTDRSVYVTTPSWADDPVTGLHRFDVDTLAHTGSGQVPGMLLNQFSLDEHDGHLRVAVTHGGRGGVGIPLPMPVDVIVEDGAVDAVAGRAAAAAPRQEDPTDTVEPTDPGEPTTTEAPTTTVQPTTSTQPPATTEPTTTTEVAPEPLPAPDVPPAPDGEALNEVVVLDTEGDLDVVGRTPRFGHPGETIHGIRFAGDVAYAVTFLTTDPFYVLDLRDATAPQVLGELEIPGFSAYLHPISDTTVIGFGPGPQGDVLARLFDVSDPTAPRVLDTAAVGEDSPVAYDHHALRTVGDRLLVPVTRWVTERDPSCASAAELEAALQDRYEAYGDAEAAALEAAGGDWSEVDRTALATVEDEIRDLERCLYGDGHVQARIATLRPTATSLQLTTIDTAATTRADRVLPLDDGYLIVGERIVRVGPDGAVQAELD